jgi:hypothetical protein
MVTLYVCVTFQAFAVIVVVTPPPVSMMSTWVCVVPGTRRIMGIFDIIVVGC